METQTLELGGKRYVIVPQDEFDSLTARANTAPAIMDDDLPPLPKPDKHGNRPAAEYMKVSIARRLIIARRKAGLTQGELAKRAGIRIETINRMEGAKHIPTDATLAKVEKVLKRLGVSI